VQCHEQISRREFIRRSSFTVGAVALGLPRLRFRRAGTGSRKLRFVFFTDVHARTEWDTLVGMAEAARAINARKPSLVVTGGDLATDGFLCSAATMAPRWDAYLTMHNAIKAPVYPAIGNHDLVAARPEDGTARAEDPRAIFRKHFGLDQTYRSFDAEGYHFMLLDSVYFPPAEETYIGRIQPGQIRWIKEDLGSVSGATPIIVVTHIPLLTAFYQANLGAFRPPPQSRVVVNAGEVLGLFKNHNLILVLQGHTHIDELVRSCGITYITGGAVCGRWWRGPYHGTEEGFGVVSLNGTQVEWEYVDYGWEARRPATG